MVPWVGLLSVIVAFPGHTHLLEDFAKRHNLIVFVTRYCSQFNLLSYRG